MNAEHSAFSAYRQAVEPLVPLSERQQIRMLKFELFDAFERADDLRIRNRALESYVAALEAHAAADAATDAFARHLHAALAAARADIAQERAAHEAEVRAIRLKLLAVESQREALEDLCRSLVVTLEQAAGGGEVDRNAASERAASEPVSPPQASAS